MDDQVFAATEELPEEYRMAVMLSDPEDLSYGEIAEVMEIPVGTVKSRLFRGRRQLQRRLYDYALEMGYISAAEEKLGVVLRIVEKVFRQHRPAGQIRRHGFVWRRWLG